MSLSFLLRLLIIGSLAAAVSWSLPTIEATFAEYLSDAREIRSRDAVIKKRSIAYRIAQDGGTRFDFAQPVRQAKILISPSVKAEEHGNPDGFVYGLRLSWFAPNGTPLNVETVFLQAASPDEVFASGLTWRFFRARDELIAEQDILLVDSSGPATRLKIEVIEADPAIVGIDVRMFERFKYRGEQSLAAFRRVTEESRRMLAEPQAFPLEMLTRREELDLSRNLWRSVGPAGLDGQDFTMLVLYEAVGRKEAEGGPLQSAADMQ